MGVQSDREIAQLVCGQDHDLHDMFAINIEEAAKMRIFTQLQALEYIGAKVKVNRKMATVRKTYVSCSRVGVYISECLE